MCLCSVSALCIFVVLKGVVLPRISANARVCAVAINAMQCAGVQYRASWTAPDVSTVALHDCTVVHKNTPLWLDRTP